MDLRMGCRKIRFSLNDCGTVRVLRKIRFSLNDCGTVLRKIEFSLNDCGWYSEPIDFHAVNAPNAEAFDMCSQFTASLDCCSLKSTVLLFYNTLRRSDPAKMSVTCALAEIRRHHSFRCKFRAEMTLADSVLYLSLLQMLATNPNLILFWLITILAL